MDNTILSARVALTAAALAVTFWAAKATAIGIAGGLDRSPFESPLFLAGLIAFVIAGASLGVAATYGRALWVRVAGGALAFVAFLALAQAVGAVTAALAPADPSWVWAELELWVIAPVALLCARVVAQLRSARSTAV